MSLTPEQIEQRRGGIGSSDVAAVCGLNPWRAPIDVWLEKTGKAEPRPDSVASVIGTEMEGVIARLYAERFGALLMEAGTVAHAEESWRLATPDRFVRGDGDGAIRIVEIKMVGHRLAHHWQDEAVPEYVTAQVLWQQDVTGIHAAHVAAVVGGTEFVVQAIEWDPDTVRMLVDVGREFWERHVLRDIPPPIDASESWKRYLASKWPRAGAKMLKADDNIDRLIKTRFAAKAAADKLAEKIELADNHLRALIGAERGISGAGWQASWTERKGSVDWQALAKELGATDEQAERHRRAGTRTMRVTQSSRRLLTS